MALPPLEDGAVQVTMAEPFAEVADAAVGGFGAPAGRRYWWR